MCNKHQTQYPQRLYKGYSIHSIQYFNPMPHVCYACIRINIKHATVC